MTLLKVSDPGSRDLESQSSRGACARPEPYSKTLAGIFQLDWCQNRSFKRNRRYREPIAAVNVTATRTNEPRTIGPKNRTERDHELEITAVAIVMLEKIKRR